MFIKNLLNSKGMTLPKITAAILLLTNILVAGHGIKTARHAYTSSNSAGSSNAFAGSYAGGDAFAGAGSIPNPAAFWWAGPDSPFKEAFEYFRRCSLKGNCGNIPGPFPGIPGNIPNNLPNNDCNSNGCSFSGSFNINDKVQPGPIDISKNPFLNGEFKGVAISSCSGDGCPGGKPHTTITTTECKGPDCKTNTQHGAPGQIDLPALTGGPFTGGAGQPFTGGAGQPGGCTSGCTGGQTNYGSTNFPATGCTGGKGSCTGHFGGTSNTNIFAGSSHTSFTGSTADGTYPSQSGQTPPYSGQVGPNDYSKSSQQPIPTTYPGQISQTNPGHQQSFSASQPGNTFNHQPVGSTGRDGNDKCYGQGLTCVEKHLCVNGFVNTDGDGLLHVRNGEKYCDTNTEVCCQLPGTSGQPHKDFNVQLPVQPGTNSQSSFYNSQKSSSAAAAASSASTQSGGSTFFSSGNPDVPSRFATPGPFNAPQPSFNPAPQPSFNPAPGVYQPTTGIKQNQPENNNPYQPTNPINNQLPGTTSQYQPTNPPGITNQYQPTNNPNAKPNSPFQPSSNNNNYQPGQTITFGGKDGTSPGTIQVIPDGPSSSRTQPPNLIRPATDFTQFNPETAASQPSLTHISPNGDVSSIQPNAVQITPTGNNFNELNFASTIQGPAYLPPGPSPSPSPSNFSPDLLPPNKPTYPQQPPQPEYRPTTPKPTFPSSPAPTNYYPTTTRFQQQQPTTPKYLPPYSSAASAQSGGFIASTKKPQVTNGYLPPNEIPSATSGSNEYLPPPKDNEQPDSNIINISVIPPNSTPLRKKPPTDRDPAPTDPRESIYRPSTPRATDFPLNTTPYPGCAAALKCVTEDFCTAEGVISPVQVILTKEQEINRVPLTECADPESGIIGKCCRDPDYKDPWPSTQLGLFNPDQDQSGSDSGQYKQIGNDGQYKPQPNEGIKGRRPGPGTRPFNPYEPNQIGSPSNNPNAVIRPGGYPTNIPNIPFDSRQVNVPVPVEIKAPIESDYSQKVLTRAKISDENCGTRHPDSKPSGPGPIDANFAEIPWQAMVLRDTNRSLLCGGAIIRRDVVLTAAHCVENLQANDVLVKGGEWKLGIDEEPKPFQINKVATIVRHPGYNPQNRLNDVALLILNEKFRLDRNVDVLCLPDPAEDVAKTFQKAKCITTGWGKTILQLNIVNSIMHILGVGIMQGNQCQQQLQQYHPESAHLYNPNCVCGAPVQQEADICDVDVGSALACDKGDGRYTLAGIYSWDTGCNPTAQVAGYTKVDTQWVEATLQRPSKDLKIEERGFYAQLQAQASDQECHCKGK